MLHMTAFKCNTEDSQWITFHVHCNCNYDLAYNLVTGRAEERSEVTRSEEGHEVRVCTFIHALYIVCATALL